MAAEDLLQNSNRVIFRRCHTVEEGLSAKDAGHHTEVMSDHNRRRSSA